MECSVLCFLGTKKKTKKTHFPHSVFPGWWQCDILKNQPVLSPKKPHRYDNKDLDVCYRYNLVVDEVVDCFKNPEKYSVQLYNEYPNVFDIL